MKRKGTSIILYNEKDCLLLFLRDDKPGLPYANMWDIPGGHVEDGETPDECIVREMKEEIGVDIGAPCLFRVYDFDDRIEYVYVSFCRYQIENLNLTEGQALRWFSEAEIAKTELAYGFNQVADDFFKSRRGTVIDS
ncbi:MAG: NUDIX hydrolase [Desulfobacteraceae bacterium]|jgi:8-oxo-dGTP diphosphatase